MQFRLIMGTRSTHDQAELHDHGEGKEEEWKGRWGGGAVGRSGGGAARVAVTAVGGAGAGLTGLVLALPAFLLAELALLPLPFLALALLPPLPLHGGRAATFEIELAEEVRVVVGGQD